MKKFLLTLAAAVGALGLWATPVTVDFSSIDGLPTDDSTTPTTLTAEGVSFSFVNCKKGTYQNASYLQISGKNKDAESAYMEFTPTFAVKTITVHTTGAASTNVTVQFYADGTAVGNALKLGAQNSDFTFSVPATSQKSGSKFKLSVTNNYNAQFTSMTFATEDGDVVTPDPVDPTPTPDLTGAGTESNPYTVTDVLALNNTKSGKAYVKGYIVGNAPGQALADAIFTAQGASATNVLIAATAGCTDYTACVPVQLPSGAIRTSINLADNPGNLGKEVLINGTLEAYFSVPGIKSPTSITILDGGSTPEPGPGTEPEQPGDESDADVLTNAAVGIGAVTSYGEFTYTAKSGAVYALQCAGTDATIQLRSDNSKGASGVISTTSAGTLQSVSLTFNEKTVSGRTVDIYASNTAYTALSDLYAEGATPVTSIAYDGTTTTYTYSFTDSYKYIGIRSKSGALYLDKVVITWGEPGQGGEQPDQPGGEVESVATIADFLELCDGKHTAKVAINENLSVAFQSGVNTYVTDGNDWLLIYGDLGKTYANGDIIPAGAAGVPTLYNALREMTADKSTFADAQFGAPVDPELVTIEEMPTDQLSKYIKIENVTISAINGKNFTITDATGSIAGYNSLNIDLKAIENATFTGFVSCFNTNVQIVPATITGGTAVEPDQPGDDGSKGSKSNPYAVSDVIALGANTTVPNAYVAGFIVGTCTGMNFDSAEFGVSDNTSNTNLLLAPTKDCKDASLCIPVQLPAGDVRTALSLQANPDNLGKAVLLCGSIEKYFGVPGLKTVTSYEFIADSDVPEGGDLPEQPDQPGDDNNGEKPESTLTCAQVIAMNPQSTTDAVQSNVWVAGYVVGYYNEYAAHFGVPETAVYANILISGNPDANDVSECVCVQLLSKTDPRAALNLSDNPTVLGKMVAVYGDVMKYNTIPGIKNTSNYYIYKEGETGIGSVVVDSEAVVEFFNLQGVRVADPTPGIYIRRSGNEVTKVVVK